MSSELDIKYIVESIRRVIFYHFYENNHLHIGKYIGIGYT